MDGGAAKLDGVGDQVDKHLLDAVLVHVHHDVLEVALNVRFEVDVSVDDVLLEQQLHTLKHLAELRNVRPTETYLEVGRVEAEGVLLDSAEVQDVIHVDPQHLARCVGALGELLHFGLLRHHLNQVEVAADGVERVAELVGHAG